VKKKIRIGVVTEPVTCYRLGANNMCASIDRMMDAERMALDSTLVSDLSGLDAFCWRQRIRSGIYFRAAMNARTAGDSRELGFVLRSVLVWPSPFFFPMRFRMLAVTLRRWLLPPGSHSDTR
jgi:hypothetical protein